RTFLRLTPSIAVITSIDVEHLDIYSDLDDIKDSFVRFANSIPFFGAAIVCLDDANVQSIVGRLDRRVVTYGISRQATVRADNVTRDGVRTSFDVFVDGSAQGRVELQVPGIHNVRNALAAFAVGLELDISSEDIALALARFSGVRRRFEILSREQDVIVVDDYAHHPVEIEATLSAATQAWPSRRLVAVFQPHLYSRTRDFKDEFARAFKDADLLVLTDVYGAREKPIAGVDGTLVADLAREYGHTDVRYVPAVGDLPSVVRSFISSGDVVIFMGAGDIWRSTRALAEDIGTNPLRTSN
ncbi:MAG: cyanophycin synthetase, partial [Rhodothermales bacterium]|nr:cyanophycin synthetase [Rhodothermales bacterium]